MAYVPGMPTNIPDQAKKKAEEAYKKQQEEKKSSSSSSSVPGLPSNVPKDVQQKAQENVYSYGATSEAMRTRRGTIGNQEVMEVVTGGAGGEYYLRVTNRAVTQHPAGDDESDIVEQGYANYRQPGPREFMTPALEDLVNSGEAEEIILRFFVLIG